MSVPDHVEEQSLALDKENNRIVIRCSECNEYEGKVDGDDYDEAEEAFNQARRMLGSHWSAKHKDGGQGGETSGNGPSNDVQGSAPPQGANPPQPSGQQQTQQQPQQGGENANSDYGGAANERELIYRRGKEGLLEIKAERLKEWLADTGGVGGQTEARIMKMFKRNDSVNSNPYALYNMLEDETTASGSFINTIVEDVFEPEREYEDMLESTGYTPFFRRSNAGGQFANQGQTMGPQQGGYNGGQQYGQQREAQQQRRNTRQQSRQQSQQRQQRSESSSDSDDLSKQEVAQMISQGINVAQEEAEENPIKDGLSDATDEALREMASNVGGLAGTANRVFEEALMSYAQENPEFIIENMDFLQSALGAAQGPDDNSQPTNQQPQSTQKVDQALEQIGDGGQSQGNSRQRQQQTQQQPAQPQQTQNTQAQPAPQPSVDTDVGPDESGFEPRHEQEDKARKQQGVANPPHPEEENKNSEPPEQKPTPGTDEAEKSEQKREQFEDESTDNEETEDDGFDELFGDMAE